MRQTVGNACGTVGLLHAVGNMTSEIHLRKCAIVVYLSQSTYGSHALHEWLWGQSRASSLNLSIVVILVINIFNLQLRTHIWISSTNLLPAWTQWRLFFIFFFIYIIKDVGLVLERKVAVCASSKLKYIGASLLPWGHS